MTETAAGDVVREEYYHLRKSLLAIVAALDTHRDTPGLQAFVRRHVDIQGFNLRSELTALRAATVTLQTQIETMLPTSGGAVLLRTLDDVLLTLSPAETAQFRTDASAFVATATYVP